MAEPQSQYELPIEWVTKDIIRQYFNDGQFFEKAKSGEFSIFTKRSSHPEEPPTGEPVCTWSQIVYYYNEDSKPVAIVHQYLRPDGSIGASGLPDPKRLLFKDRIVSVRSDE